MKRKQRKKATRAQAVRFAKAVLKLMEQHGVQEMSGSHGNRIHIEFEDGKHGHSFDLMFGLYRLDEVEMITIVERDSFEAKL